MPNWVFNSVVISGDESELEELQAQLNAPIIKHFPETFFNKVTGKWENEPASQYYSSPVFSFWNVVAPTDLDSYYGKEKEKVGSDNFMQDFHNALAKGESWYYWNLRNWGTKWDVAVSDNDKYSTTNLEITDDGDLMYRFETAWSPVPEIFQKLSEMYPKLTFNYEYEEEQGWGGSATWLGGECISQEEYDIPSSHADYVERDREDVCNCMHEDNQEYWFADCPREVVEA